MKSLSSAFIWFVLLVSPVLTWAGETGIRSSLPECSTQWTKLIPQNLHNYQFNPRESYRNYQDRVQRKNCRKPWTVLIYMQADNDLLPYAYWDLYEMEAGYSSGRAFAGSTLKSDLLVQLDTKKGRKTRRLHLFQSPSLYDDTLSLKDFEGRSERDILSPTVGFVKDAPINEAEKLERFLQWGIKAFPADHYMVVVWGHGKGWTSTTRHGEHTDPFGGLAFNDSQGTYLSIPALSRVLGNISTRLLQGRPIDLYASDACLMQMLEVASEVSPHARFIVGSTQVQNFLGLPYRRLMYEVNTGRFAGEKTGKAKNDEPLALARAIPKVFEASMQGGGLQGRIAPDAIKTITMSSLSSDELNQSLLPAFKKLGVALDHYIKMDPIESIHLQALIKDTPGFAGGSQELGSFLVQLDSIPKKPSELDRAISGAQAALDRTVVSYAVGTDYLSSHTSRKSTDFRAISLWLPESKSDLKLRLNDFDHSRFYLQTHWQKWLVRTFSKN